MDYSTYHFSFREWLELLFKTLVVSAGLSYLFYRSWWGMLITPCQFYILFKWKKQAYIEQRKTQLHQQFIDCLKVICSCLMAGMSMENAWSEATKGIGAMHGEKCILYSELKEMNALIETNVPIEQVLLAFAYRSGVDDIISFAEVFAYGKRSGGNWRKIIEDTTLRMEERYETKKQIEVMISGKKMEQKIMNVIPLLMILFLQISSGDYMDILYGNPIGVVCMSICLAGYGVSVFLAQKIMKIQV